MIKNYFKIAWRNMLRSKLYSLVNLLGLSIGICCCVLIFLFVKYELSYDRYNEKCDRIVRMTTVSQAPSKTDRFAPSSPMMGSNAKANFPEVEDLVRFNGSSRSLSYGEKHFYDTKIFYADSGLLDVFTFPVIEGDAKGALNKPYSVVLTETAKKKYFGDEPAYGKIMKLSDTINMQVTAVIQDIPENSHFNFECFLSRVTMNEMNKMDSSWAENSEKNWFSCNSFTYLLLKEGVDPEVLEKKINAQMDKEMADIRKQVGMWMNIDLQALSDIHLKSHLEAEFPGNTNGYMENIYIFSGSALLILIIACFNFINLSTAKSINRSKEIGLRKVIGASRKQLIGQFLGESIFFAFLSGILSFGFVLLMLPLFNSFLGTHLSPGLDLLVVYLVILLGVGLLSGLYPAFLMSSFSPITSLKGKIRHGIADIIFRKGLVVFQFAIAVVLIVCTTIVLNQLSFIQAKNIGMNKDRLLNLELRQQDLGKGELLVQELKKLPFVSNSSLNSFHFKFMSNITLLPEGVPETEMMASNVFVCDENFLKTYEIPLVAGTDFSSSRPTEMAEGFIVNEQAVKDFRWKTPQNAIGKKVNWGGMKEGKIIGVVKNFNFQSLKDNIKPVIFHVFPGWSNNITVKLKTDDISGHLSTIENTWKQIAVHSPFKYSFVEEDFDSLYKSEAKIKSVLSTFTGLSIFVACLGLFGLAAFTIRQRYREIGIRKVLGSSEAGIVKKLSADFLRLVVVSVIIAVPLAWYASYKWLQDFAYRTELSWWIFVVSGSAALLIAFATVSIQALRAARANPVKSLRTE